MAHQNRVLEYGAMFAQNVGATSTSGASTASSAASAVDAAIARAHALLLASQEPDGHWVGELEADSSISSEYIVCGHLMDRVDREREAKIVAYLRSRQLPDGGWSLYEGGARRSIRPIKAYFAMKVAGVSAEDAAMARARDLIRERGGPGRGECLHQDHPRPVRRVRLVRASRPCRSRSCSCPAVSYFNLLRGVLLVARRHRAPPRAHGRQARPSPARGSPARRALGGAPRGDQPALPPSPGRSRRGRSCGRTSSSEWTMP